ncbi:MULTISPECIES: hypothetical protein [unclassified Streptomyces]|uniref:hypothetical protein n=1 Tax=unclassified Streptomyces TaxID=2593676 RepID=UPI0025570C93|nr:MULTISPECIES: hypothetical protein [unclassified Streptomyces]WRZ67302.1 hypothetical protein OG408_26980 [Streptomyces sp. NBC_01257]WSU61316.1 hypothetical protein OG450_27275 [Streptomyces sp. NBC_01104]
MDATSPVGALLLCRAEPETVRPVAQLLREPMLLAPAGDGWSVLVPGGEPWRGGRDGHDGEPAEPVDRVLGGWATALAVGSTWPVLALWWDGDRAGYTLAAGFRRPVGYVWLADGTPAGEDEATRTFAERLGLDPVLDVQALEALTRPDPGTDARTRLRGLLAVLTRTGLALPPGLDPGEPSGRLAEGAAAWPESERIEWTGWRDAVKVELEAVENSRLGPWMRGPRARALAGAQLAAGLPLALWGAGRRSGGWIFAGALLMVHGALGLAYDRIRDGDAPDGP